MNTGLAIWSLATRVAPVARPLKGTQDATEPPAPPLLTPARPKRLVLLVVAVVSLLLLLAGVGYFTVTWLRERVRPAPAVVATFWHDFQRVRPKAGWRYLWNAYGPVGDAANYAELRWQGSMYAADAAPASPAPSPAAYLRITRGGGHPGLGGEQGREVGNDLDRYAIVAFTVTAPGLYWIKHSVLARHDGTTAGDIDLRVFVNDREVGVPLQCASADGLSFDRELGTLSTGDAIYVAVGPNGGNWADTFDLDFSVAQ